MRRPRDYRNQSARARRIAWLLDLAAAAGGPLLRGLRARGSAGDPPRAILVVRLDHLGDVLMTTPAIAALREAFPRARLDVLAAPWGRAALEGNPHVDAVHLAEAPWYEPRLGRRLPALRGLRRLASELRARGYDWAFDMRGDPRVVLFYMLRAAPRRFGFSHLGLEGLLTDRVPYDRGRSFLDLALDLARAAGAEPRRRRPVFVVRDEDRRDAASLLRDGGVPAGSPVAVLSPGSNRPEARWPAERFGEVARGLAARGFVPVVTGREADRQATSVAAAGSPAVDLTGRTSFRALAALLERAALLVANDSAPAHLAAAVGCPAVVLFGPSDPQRSFPYGGGRGFACLAAPFDHERPCYDPRCPSDHGLRRIEPAEVVRAALAVAGGARAELRRGGAP